MKADIDKDCSDHDCKKCSDRDECDLCGRRMCKWVAVQTFENLDTVELICRPCAQKAGWNRTEIESQAVDTVLKISGDKLQKRLEAKNETF